MPQTLQKSCSCAEVKTDAPSVDKMAGMPKVQQYSLRTLMILAESSFGSLKTESQLEYLSHKAR